MSTHRARTFPTIAIGHEWVGLSRGTPEAGEPVLDDGDHFELIDDELQLAAAPIAERWRGRIVGDACGMALVTVPALSVH